MKEKLLGKTPAQLREIAVSLGLKAFVGDQIASWIYAKRVRSLEQMTNISKTAMEKIASEYELGLENYSEAFLSKDGTKKYLFGCSNASPEDGFAKELYVEAVVIPTENRATLCVLSAWLQDGMPFLHDRTSGLPRQP